jgi:anti-sigma B factor antagonist
MAAEFSIGVEQGEDTCVLAVRGDLDVYTAPRLKQEFVELIGGGCIRLVLDLERVEFIDSSALGVLIGALRRVREKGGAIHIVCTRANVLNLFRLTGLYEVFPVFATAAKASVF